MAGVRVCVCWAGGVLLLQALASIASVQRMLLLSDETADCRVLQMWPCSHTLTSRGRAMASSQGTAVTPGMGSGRATGSSRAMGSKDMEGSLTAARMEATRLLLAILHKVGEIKISMLTCHDARMDSSHSLMMLWHILSMKSLPFHRSMYAREWLHSNLFCG